MLVKKIIFNTLNVLYPVKCAVCNCLILNSENSTICKKCLKTFKVIPPPKCILCGRYIPNLKKISNKCYNCISNEKKIWYDELYSIFFYKDTVKKALYAIKYYKNLHLAKKLANIFADKFYKNSYYKNIDLITSIPLYKKRKKQRGFNQSDIFAKYISKKINKKFHPNILFRTRRTYPQSDLNKYQRLKNVQNAFNINPKYDIKDIKILLIDDIFTTGSTINECSKVLKINRARYIKAATFARG